MKKISFLILLMAMAVASGCKKDESSSSSGNIVEINNNITEPTTWTTGKIYVIKKYDFYVRNALTIQPGVVVKFPPNYYMVVGDDGTIIASGTQDNPIIFTSMKDDAHGGDTNRDGSVTTPSAGDWGYVSVYSNGNTFTWCEFWYGGGSSYLNTLEIYDGTASITYCLFTKNKGGKVGSLYYGALDASSARDQTVIRNNTFYDNILPLSVSSVISIDNTNTFSKPGDATVKNKMNGIFIYNLSYINKAVTWAETEVPFVINDHDMWIVSPGSLTLAPNVIVKFTPNSYLTIGTGAALNFNSTNYFTSFKDDSRGGDTNGDGNATTPSNGDWGGIYNNATGVYLSGANILYDSY